AGGRLEPRRPQGVHAGAERADTGQHDAVGGGDQLRIVGEPGVGAHLLERLACRVDVADAVVEDGDERSRGCAHSTPLVDGTPPGASTRTASRSERASPLNVASTMWCTLRPRTSWTCSVIAAAVANDDTACWASCGSNGGLPSGSASGSSTSQNTNGRPDRSRATSTSASSSG